MNKEQIFTIFGGTGDLTFRKLLPALYNIEASDDKVFCPRVVVIGRRDYTSETYRTMAREWVEKFARLHFKEETYQKLAERILYYRMDFTDEKEYGGLDSFYKKWGPEITYFILPLPPDISAQS